MRGHLAVSAALVVALVAPALAHAAPPANDAFASAETISGASGTVYGTTVDATSEPGEPQSLALNHSIWYAWTAPDYGTLNFDTAGTTYAWVFTGGALDALDLKINGQGYGFVSVRAGVTYRIALDDWTAGGPTQLSWQFDSGPPPPANDDWANAETLTGDGGNVDVDTLGATRESCESTLGYGKTLWYRWTATQDGELTVDANTDLRGTIVGVFTGDSLCTLVERAQSGGDPATTDVVAGDTYWVALDTWGDGGGPTSFSWSFATVTRPVNDSFADALPLGPAYRGTVTGTALHATAEPGEWTPFFGRTVWYAWTPAESGVASINVQLADVVVSTGDAVDALTTVAYGNSTFQVTGGTTYRIQVSGGSSETFTVEWLLEPDRAPANDDFANATPLDGASGTVEATNRLATLEPGEPDHGGTSGASVWFTWLAPASGAETFHVDSSFWTIHAVYVGKSVSSLTAVDVMRDVDAQVVTFTAQAGTTYRIAVDGRAGGTGIFWLSWVPAVDGGGGGSGGGGGGGTTGTAPDARPDSFVTNEDEALVVTAADLLDNDSDADGDALVLKSVAATKKTRGTVKLTKGRIVFTPAADFNGTTAFEYVVADATGLESRAAVTVEVLPVNDPPTVELTADPAAEGSPVTVVAHAEDVDGDALTYDWSTDLGTIAGDGENAALTVDDGPATAAVQVFVYDGQDSSSAFVYVDVANVAPTIDAADASGVWGLPVAVTGTVTDASSADAAAGLAPKWSLGGSLVAALTASRTYDAPGTYPATLSATDKDGATASRDVAVVVGARPSTLALVGASSVPFGFGSLAARLGDGADAATARVDGHAVTFAAGGATFAGTTAGGVATADLGPALLPGTYAVGAQFGGDSLYLPAAAGGSVTVTNTAGKLTGDVVLGDGTAASLNVSSDGTIAKGNVTAGAFTASKIAAFAVSGAASWVAGTGDDGRAFVAYVEDHGEPGRGADVVRLWIAGDLRAGSGAIADGNLQLHK